MFTLCHNFYKWAREKSEKRLTFCVLGIDNAGKTSVIHALKNEIPAFVTPTWGFSSEDIPHSKDKINVFDLGGGVNIRGIWQNYYAESHGVIYVIDSSDVSDLTEIEAVLREVMEDPRLKGKPFLILANKQDVPGAVKGENLTSQLRLHEMKATWNERSCTALTPPDGTIDPSIKSGLDWLVTEVKKQFKSLETRIQTDVAAQKEKERKELEEKKKRVERIREERRRAQEQQAREDAEKLEKEALDNLPSTTVVVSPRRVPLPGTTTPRSRPTTPGLGSPRPHTSGSVSSPRQLRPIEPQVPSIEDDDVARKIEFADISADAPRASSENIAPPGSLEGGAILASSSFTSSSDVNKE